MSTGIVYDSRAIANYLIEGAREHGGLDALQVVKLVYLSHGWVLGLLDRPLLEEDIEAWQYGPVIRRLYPYVAGRRSAFVDPIENFQADLRKEEKSVVDQTLEKYGRLSGLQLSALTHKPGTPWDVTWSAYGKNAVIPQDLIQKHFNQLVEISRSG